MSENEAIVNKIGDFLTGDFERADGASAGESGEMIDSREGAKIRF